MNQLTASIEFYFKGERLAPTARLDLDQLMQQYGTLPDFHSFLAQQNNIGVYSYEYELFLSEDIQFTQATDGVSDFIENDQFDQTGFEQHWHQQQMFNHLAPVLKQQLDIDDINQQPALKTVLLAAWQLAKKD
ncbi:MAG: hypothetical protein COA90_06320 [Gammaproteobacteria bacterium]|nr:MAG: hypothetical protein COA90_06320 [Gammaproteobacteria bacterium]